MANELKTLVDQSSLMKSKDPHPEQSPAGLSALSNLNPDGPDDPRWKVPAINQKLELLAIRLNLIDVNEPPEAYTLTAEEEDAVVAHEITRLQKLLAWKMAEMAYREEQILAKIAGIDWEQEINRKELLATANSNKNHGLWVESQRRKAAEEKKQKQLEVDQQFTATFAFNIMRWTSENIRKKPLIINEYNKHLIKALCFFISGDPRFETELHLDFRKGLLIRGIPGLGKTYLVTLLKENEKRPITCYNMISISKKVAQFGLLELDIPERGIIYLDDVGSEQPEVLHYGTRINFYKDFIEEFDLNHSAEFNKLIITTNINNAEMEEKYGARVRSRHKHMFNWIDVTGTDMRG
jgi:hypothetical protein